MTKIAELYGLPTVSPPPQGWSPVAARQRCPFLNRTCVKSRKSDKRQTIGTCTLLHGQANHPIMVCPGRFFGHRQIFRDCVDLLSDHEKGNELHLVSQFAVPGGNIDHCLLSVRKGKVVDVVGIELQTLDTTGTAWPDRQQFLRSAGVTGLPHVVATGGKFQMNWKMTAKTILMQLHHKLETFDHLGKRLVLVLQDRLLDYMRREFAFGHVTTAKEADPQHFHSYEMVGSADGYTLRVKERLSTDAAGVVRCLGLKGDPRVEFPEFTQQLNAKLSAQTLFTLDSATPLDVEVPEQPE